MQLIGLFHVRLTEMSIEAVVILCTASCSFCIYSVVVSSDCGKKRAFICSISATISVRLCGRQFRSFPWIGDLLQQLAQGFVMGQVHGRKVVAVIPPVPTIFCHVANSQATITNGHPHNSKCSCSLQMDCEISSLPPLPFQPWQQQLS